MPQSAHVDDFCRKALPPHPLWPEMRYDRIPELAYPPRLNCAVELLDYMVARGHADDPAIEAMAPQEGPRRRPIWPWILAAVLLLAALIGGWYVYNQIQDELASREPVAVPLLVGVHENQATAELDARNLQYKLIREPNTDQPKNFVFAQDPEEGTKIDPQTGVVTLRISTGCPTRTRSASPGNMNSSACTFAVSEITYSTWSPATSPTLALRSVTTPGIGAGIA